MKKENNILIITDDENSETVRLISRLKLVPIIRRSILSAIEFLRHYSIAAIIIDKQHQNVDAIEFILNARDVAQNISILLPEQYYETEDWSMIRTLGNIRIYDEKKFPLRKEIDKITKQEKQYRRYNVNI